jgi:hypothetical protein
MAAMPKHMMRAIRLHEFGGPEVLRHEEVPVAGKLETSSSPEDALLSWLADCDVVASAILTNPGSSDAKGETPPPGQ